MSTILVLIVGTTDLQLMCHTTQKRHPIDYNQLDSLPPNLPFIWQEEYQEENKKLGSGCIDAIALPRIRKAVCHMLVEGVNKIDHLMLVATDRRKELAFIDLLLAETSPEIITPSFMNRVNDLRDFARKDPSYEFAKKAKELLSKNSNQLSVEISHISVVGLGNGTYLDSLKESGYNSASLDRFDINKADFFDFELIEAVMPYLRILQNSRIFVASWGGFQNLHKSLDRVLRSLLTHPIIIPVHTNETGSYLTEDISQSKFLELHRNMNRAAIEMDWGVVKQLFDLIQIQKPEYFKTDQIRRMNCLLDKIGNSQKDPKNWFSNFFVLIIRALYVYDLNGLYIWLKCLDEAAFVSILENKANCETNGYRFYRNVPLRQYFNSKYGKGSVLVFKDGSIIEARFKEVWSKLHSSRNMGLLSKYAKLFYSGLDSPNSKDDYPANTAYKKLIQRRNSLIHDGIPIQKEQALYLSILSFINVKPDEHKQAIISLKELNWNALEIFERSVLDGNFFSFMKEVSGITEPDWLPLDRLALDDYLSIIYHQQ